MIVSRRDSTARQTVRQMFNSRERTWSIHRGSLDNPRSHARKFVSLEREISPIAAALINERAADRRRFRFVAERSLFCPFRRTAIRHASRFRGVIKESAEQHDASGLSEERGEGRRKEREPGRRRPTGAEGYKGCALARDTYAPSPRGTYFHITKPSACRA